MPALWGGVSDTSQARMFFRHCKTLPLHTSSSPRSLSAGHAGMPPAGTSWAPTPTACPWCRVPSSTSPFAAVNAKNMGNVSHRYCRGEVHIRLVLHHTRPSCSCETMPIDTLELLAGKHGPMVVAYCIAAHRHGSKASKAPNPKQPHHYPWLVLG